VKHFRLAPRIVIERAHSPQCRLRLEATAGSRTWALATKTNFSLETTVQIGGRQETTRTASSVSCFDEDSPVRLAAGDLVPVKELVPGDKVWNPILHRGIPVREVIQGTEADETMYHVGYASASIWFTGQHPVFTQRGMRPASSVMPGDAILGDDGAYHVVTVREVHGGNPDHLVYNLALDATDTDVAKHWMSVGGMVVGDFFLQQSRGTHEAAGVP
jgi:Hint-domain